MLNYFNIFVVWNIWYLNFFFIKEFNFIFSSLLIIYYFLLLYFNLLWFKDKRVFYNLLFKMVRIVGKYL